MDFRHILEKSNEEHHLLDVLTTSLENKSKGELKKKNQQTNTLHLLLSHTSTLLFNLLKNNLLQIIFSCIN